ncbi:hypothetical protein TI03_01490 [Achromatium sp. WMS1]|nr:hypothetical protein TI03_01490 [Achromatium sp. WMS1]
MSFDHSMSASQSVSWRTLRLFFIYRLVLALSMWFVFSAHLNLAPIGNAFPKLFIITIVIYFFLLAMGALLLIWETFSAELQVQIAIYVDIVIITMVMHTSGGITTGLGLLLAISITLGSLLTGGRMALPFAALASLAVLIEQLYAESFNIFSTNVNSYTQAGLLGITFFAVALLAYGLARQLRETEQLAQQRGLDLANLAQVNEYIIQHMNTGVLVVDQSWKICLLNETAWRLLGNVRAKVGDNVRKYWPDLARQAMLWIQDLPDAAETFCVQPGGKELRPQFIPLSQNQQFGGILIFLEDSARLLEQAQQMKLASLGRLTASIAHEIRNPLGAISHAGQLLEESPSLHQSDQRLMEIIRSNSQRVNNVIESVLQLSRRSRTDPEYVTLDLWVEQFLTEFCHSHILPLEYFNVQILPPSVCIQTDTRQLTQVLENLCDNALRYSNSQTQPPYINLYGGKFPDIPLPILEIIDNGPGIASENMRQIFEPFFTTAAKGTGLGLYIAKELCEINKIGIEYVKLTTGSCFRLSFYHWRLNDNAGS